MGWGPRGLFEEHAFNQLADVTPDAGDILICKEWSNRPPGEDSKSSVVFGIRAGQALFSRMRHGSRNSEHAALCVGTYGRWRMVCEANGGRVHKTFIEDRDMVVYRCRDLDLRNEAVNVAEILTGDRARADGKKLAAAEYSWDKAKKAVFKSKTLGAQGQAYRKTLYDKVYGDGYGDPPPMFCSEFVTVCYVLAASHLRKAVAILDVDPRAISPKALESLLERGSGWFIKTGRVRDTTRPAPAKPSHA